MAFASKSARQVRRGRWQPAPVTGSPMIDGALAWIDCEVEAEHDGGDHTIVVGRVVHVDIEEGDVHPLVFYRAGFGHFES